MNFALADAGIVSFDAKYDFRFWRPYTAIRRAGEDDNDRTEADPEWLPLLWTPPGEPLLFLIPPIPDYPSAAAMTSAAAAAVLTTHLGDSESFTVSSVTLPGANRRFRSFNHAAREAGLSRVYGGHSLRSRGRGRLDGWQAHRSRGESSAGAEPPSRLRALTHTDSFIDTSSRHRCESVRRSGAVFRRQHADLAGSGALRQPRRVHRDAPLHAKDLPREPAWRIPDAR
jgi:hypothetical protein